MDSISIRWPLGHVHIRKNLYKAILKVEAKDKVWKITGLELLDEKRIDSSAELVRRTVTAGSE